MGDEPPNEQDMICCLQEAGFYEESMRYEDMLPFYQAIKSSENTAHEEKKRRTLSQDNCSNVKAVNKQCPSKTILQDKIVEVKEGFEEINVEEKTQKHEKSFTPKTWSTKKSNLPLSQIEEDTLLEQVVTTIPNLAEEELKQDIFVDIFDCPKDLNTPLPYIEKSPDFNQPYYCSPLLQDLTSEMKAKAIFNYHFQVLQQYHNFQRKSIHSTPWGKPIPSNSRFNSTLCKRRCNYDIDDDNDADFEIYTSRTGRQTKRKVYTESATVMDKGSKKTKLENRKKEPEPPTENIISTPVSVKKRLAPNVFIEEPLKKSKLVPEFAKQERSSKYDVSKTPKLQNPSSKNSRADKMFDKLIEHEIKQKEAEKQKDKFVESLKDLSDGELIENAEDEKFEVAEILHKEEPFKRKKVIPPLPGPSGIRRRQAIVEDKEPSQSPYNIEFDRSPTCSQEEFKSAASGRRRKLATNQQQCPICNKMFYLSEIEEHASTCGLTNIENVVDVGLNSGPAESIVCHLCDKVFTLNTEYEVHVMDCKKRKSYKK